MQGKIFILLILILISNIVYSISVTPPDKVLIFNPGEEICSFNVRADKDTTLGFRIEGDLKDYVNLTYSQILAKKDLWYPIQCTVNLPADLKPGSHEANIITIEDIKHSGLGAIAGIIFPVKVFVPYPGKYLEIQKYEVKNIAINETANFRLIVINRGQEKIQNLTAIINILNPDDKLISTIYTKSMELSKDSTGELNLVWDSTGVPAGIYNAEAIVYYDQKQAKEIKEIRIGELKIEIIKISHDKILTNSISKFNLKLRSLWNSPIDEAYLMATILDANEKIVKEVRGENFQINSWTEMEQSIFLDTNNIPPGKYKGNFTVYHSLNRAAQKSIEFDITESLLDKYPVITLSLIIVIIIMGILLFRNMLKNRK